MQLDRQPVEAHEKGDGGHARVLEWRWMGVVLRLPAGWWMAEHSTNAQRGTLAFVDRGAQRLAVTWTQAKPTLDIERMRNDWLAHQRSLGSTARRFAFGPWRGLLIREHHNTRWQAVMLDPANGRLLEVVVPVGPRIGTSRLVRSVLNGVSCEAAGDRANVVALLGVRIAAPTGWRQWSAKVEPGLLSVTFVKRDPGMAEPSVWVRVSRRRLGVWDGEHSALLESQHTERLQRERAAWEPVKQKRWRGIGRRHIRKRWLLDAQHDVSVEVVSRGLWARHGAASAGDAFEVCALPWLDAQHEAHGAEPQREAGWLAWMPTPNPAVRVTQRGGSVLLCVPIRRTWWGETIKLRNRRVWELDRAGSALWRLIDGQRTMATLIEHTSRSESLTHAQARACVGSFMRELLRRGAVVVVGGASDPQQRSQP